MKYSEGIGVNGSLSLLYIYTWLPMLSANGMGGVGPSGDISDVLIGQWLPFRTTI